MASTKSTAFAETNPIKIQLARDEEGWSELRELLSSYVSQLLGSGKEESVKALMFIVDVLTNEDVDPYQQNTAADIVLQAAFAHSVRATKEMRRYLDHINPGRVIRRRKVVVHA